MMKDPEKAKKEYLQKLEFLLSVTYDYLGEKTVEKWFRQYANQYSKEQLKALRK